MLLLAVIAVVVFMLPVAYVIFRKYTFTRQEIEFGAPQNGVAAIHLDIREDSVRSLRVLYEDGTVSEIRRLDAA